MSDAVARVLVPKQRARDNIRSLPLAELRTAVRTRLAQPTMTDDICRSLCAAASISVASSTGTEPARRIDGYMALVRLPTQKQAAVMYERLQTFLWLTRNKAEPWWRSGSQDSPSSLPQWQKFQVIMDLGQDDQKDLSKKLCPDLRSACLGPTHPSLHVSPVARNMPCGQLAQGVLVSSLQLKSSGQSLVRHSAAISQPPACWHLLHPVLLFSSA